MKPETAAQPFLDGYLAYLLAKASQQVSSGFHAELKTLDVPVSTWRILVAVRKAEMNVGDLAAIVLFKQPALSKALDRLQDDGLVRRVRYDEHRRNVFVAITLKGEKLVEKLIPRAIEHEQKVLTHMSNKERMALKNSLSQLIAQLS